MYDHGWRLRYELLDRWGGIIGDGVLLVAEGIGRASDLTLSSSWATRVVCAGKIDIYRGMLERDDNPRRGWMTNAADRLAGRFGGNRKPVLEMWDEVLFRGDDRTYNLRAHPLGRFEAT